MMKAFRDKTVDKTSFRKVSHFVIKAISSNQINHAHYVEQSMLNNDIDDECCLNTVL